MSITRSYLARLAGLLTLAFVLAAAYLSWTDGVAAQQAGKKKAPKAVKNPKMEIPAADLAIMKALDTRIKVSIKGELMKKVLESLDERTKGALNIIVDELGIREAMIDTPLFLNDPVVKEYKSLTIRELLRMILKERGMGYYIEDNSVIVTKDTKALSKMVVKSYPVANLVGGQILIDAAIRETFTAKELGPLCQLLSQNIDGLTAQVMGTIEPDYWKVGGTGPGTMVFVPNTASLQVRASLEVHYLISASGILDNSRVVAEPAKAPSAKELKTVVVKVHSIAGLLDPKNLDKSKVELENALKLLGVHNNDKDAPSIAILAHAELLVVRQPLEMQLQIDDLLSSMRYLRGLQAGLNIPRLLPPDMGGPTFGMQGGTLFGSYPGVFGNPRKMPDASAPPAGGGFLGDVK